MLAYPAFRKAPCGLLAACLLKWMLGERAELLLAGQRALPSKVQALGYSFQYPTLEKALKAAIAD